MQNESNGGWVDLHTYSKKFGVSLSTLRRRIRAKTIEFKLMRGRYWLPDNEEVMRQAPLFSRGSNPGSKKTENLEDVPTQTVNSTQFAGGPRPEDAQRIVELETENRRLKSRIAEFETLVSALENELNARSGTLVSQ